MVQEIIQTGSLKDALKSKLAGRLKMAKLLEVSEENFYTTVKEIESDNLFQQLLAWEGVRHRRFPGVSPAFFRRVSLDENCLSSRTEKTLSLDEETEGLIKKIGKEKFIRFFLTPENVFSRKEVSSVCNLNGEEIDKIVDFINNFSFSSFFYQSTPHSPRSPKRLSIIATVQRDGKKLSLFDLTFDLVKGEYIIDELKVNQLKNSLSPKERKK